GICHRFTSTDQLMPGCIAGEPRDGEVGASCRLPLTGPAGGLVSPEHPSLLLKISPAALATIRKGGGYQ
ncbi:hypothetical protein, partial [Bradyrhizobium sp. 142]|uniref:hypothetical protein n=1 Tax=Bradyrhizobium sp. 142 TaxID=2782618 RepID=UPI001FF7B900